MGPARRLLLKDLALPLGHRDDAAGRILAEALGGSPADFLEPRLERLSLDARHKGCIRWLAALSFRCAKDPGRLVPPAGARIEVFPALPPVSVSAVPRRPRVVIAGTGPAGSFCALRLLDYGIEPLLLERGPSMDARIRAVETLWREGRLDPAANAQFGEGGAGTFSDGKLATRIGHPAVRYVLETFVRLGANPEILYLAKPHVGTEGIRACMVRLRLEAEARGAEYRFQTRLAALHIREGRLVGVETASGQAIPCEALVLATGHSARDTYRMLRASGVAMIAKPFAMGLRIEHPQDLVDRAQYGPSAGHPELPPSDYRLACTFSPERAAYSFCMCPGGQVIQAASEPGGLVVNGMSGGARDSGYANAGIVAKVGPADFGSEDPLAGVDFQRSWEEAAFRAAGDTYGAPASTVRDFLRGRSGSALPRSTFRPALVPADLRRCLPEVVVHQLTEAFPVFDRRLKGFTSEEALLLGIESRTSSPVRILRGGDGQSPNLPGLYPCGEGAGHAGGISSAAVDGLRVAEWIAQAAGAPVFEPFARRGDLSDWG